MVQQVERCRNPSLRRFRKELPKEIRSPPKTASIDTVNFIWALARKLTASREEAEAAAAEIFTDIWQHCAGDARSLEEKLITLIALRRLSKPLQSAGNKFTATRAA